MKKIEELGFKFVSNPNWETYTKNFLLYNLTLTRHKKWEKSLYEVYVSDDTTSDEVLLGSNVDFRWIEKLNNFLEKL